MGDTAQLPPVGQTASPALSENVIAGYGLNVYKVFLSEIARQAQQSGIIVNATALRNAMLAPVTEPPRIDVTHFDDTEAITGEFMLEMLSSCYDSGGTDDTIVITRSNARASAYNSQSNPLP